MVHIGWPQGVYLAWTLLGILGAGLLHGKVHRYNGWSWFISSMVNLAFLWWGGFFR